MALILFKNIYEMILPNIRSETFSQIHFLIENRLISCVGMINHENFDAISFEITYFRLFDHL
jgi:hypothetical protein